MTTPDFGFPGQNCKVEQKADDFEERAVELAGHCYLQMGGDATLVVIAFDEAHFAAEIVGSAQDIMRIPELLRRTADNIEGKNVQA